MTKLSQPLVVDLDGTLIKTDLLLESFMILIKQNPFNLIFVLIWLLQGKAVLKAEIAKRVEIPVDLLPYNGEVLEYLQNQKQQGRLLYLATASNKRYADAIAHHLGLFEAVFSSDENINLSGTHKREYLNKQFSETGYVYAGNAEIDLKVWEQSSAAVVVGTGQLTAKAKKLCPLEKHIHVPNPHFKSYIKALRVHQWVKNGLIFVPLLTSHSMNDPDMVIACLLAFAAFSLCASSVYFLNDLLDLNDDRCHPTKKDRPFAAGSLSLLVGIIGTPMLLGLSGFFCLFLPIEFFLTLLAYYGLTIAYSFKLKRLVMVDVVTLASLYTIRIVAGVAAIGVAFSFWLLSFSVFVFLSLAIVKRYTELMKLRDMSTQKALGRGYQVKDVELLSSLGGASGYISVLVLALYINSPDIRSLYSQPEIMWPTCLVMLYWVSRVWIIAHRGHMNDDPILFALKDTASLVCGAIIGAFMLMAV